MRPGGAVVVVLVTLVATGCPMRPDDHRGGRTCPIGLCGSASGIPAYQCSDGSQAGPTGRCVADELDVCDWEIRYCENEPPPCIRAGCEGERCVELGASEMQECDYSYRLDCDWRGDCERQDDGTCGFSINEDVLKCERFGPAP